MIETSAVSYAPSLTVLREMRAQRQHSAGLRRQATALLALGNPAIGKETIERAALALRDEKLDSAARSRKGGQSALGRLYGAPRSKVYIGAEAREDRVKAEAGTGQDSPLRHTRGFEQRLADVFPPGARPGR